MATKTKKYKAGQCVTLCNRIFRIMKRDLNTGFVTCKVCEITNHNHLCDKFDTDIKRFCALKLPYGHFLKEVHPSHDGEVCDK